MTTNIHNRCDVRESPSHPNRGTCPAHSVPVYRDGLDWFTDNGLSRNAKLSFQEVLDEMSEWTDEELTKLVRELQGWGIADMTPLEEHLWAVRSTKREKAIADFKESELIR